MLAQYLARWYLYKIRNVTFLPGHQTRRNILDSGNKTQYVAETVVESLGESVEPVIPDQVH